MLPAVIYLVVMFCYPLYYNVSMSLRHFTVASFLTGVAPFVGFQNYTDMFGGRLFNQALVTTAIFTVLSIAGQMTIGMLLALFFWRRFRFNAAMRALLLAPWLLPLVVSASVWQWMFAQDYGIINHVLLQLGIVVVQGAVAGRFDLRARRGDHHQYLDRHPVLDGGLPQRAASRCRRSFWRRRSSTAPGRCSASSA